MPFTAMMPSAPWRRIKRRPSQPATPATERWENEGGLVEEPEKTLTPRTVRPVHKKKRRRPFFYPDEQAH
jgi:hypothetical protein